MTNQILLRSDDLGYSRGVNYGTLDAVHRGLIHNVGIMVNMPFAEDGYKLIKDENVAFGLHTNISNGRPLTDPKLIPSITTPDGYFKSSKTYRSAKEDFVNLDEVMLEIEAQYQRFVQMTGQKPTYFEGHAVVSDNFVKGMKLVAKKHHAHYLGFTLDGSDIPFGRVKFKTVFESMYPDTYNPVETVKRAAEYSKIHDDLPMIIFHCGYLDQYILDHSSMTITRPKESEASCSQELAKWLEDNNIELVRYDQLY